MTKENKLAFFKWIMIMIFLVIGGVFLIEKTSDAAVCKSFSMIKGISVHYYGSGLGKGKIGKIKVSNRNVKAIKCKCGRKNCIKITGKKAGKATVTIKIGKKITRVKVTVVKKPEPQPTPTPYPWMDDYGAPSASRLPSNNWHW